MNITQLPHDDALPHLATALDGAAMGRVFDELLAAEGGPQVQACRIDRVKYRPRRNCSVSYRLGLRDARSGRIFEQAVSARWCRAGESAQRHHEAARRAQRASEAGPALSHLPAFDLCLAWLPNDPKLDALTELFDDERLRIRWLPEVVAALTLGRGRLVAHRATLVQWVPEHRACVRVELQIDQADGLHTHTVYAKADTEHSGATSFAVLRALRDSPAQAEGRLRSAMPILWQPEAGVFWQQAIEGRPLAEFGPMLGTGLAAKVGALLAALHATPLPTPRRITSDDLRRQRHDTVTLLAGVEPAWSAMLDRLLRALDGTAVDTAPPATLHGDPHRFNLLQADAGLALIDLDGALQGPAVIELGGWIAESLYLALLGGQAPGAAAPQWRAMLRGYATPAATPAAAAGAPMPDEAQLAWACAHQLLCQRAYRCVANLKPGRLALVPVLLRLAEAIACERRLEATIAGVAA